MTKRKREYATKLYLAQLASLLILISCCSCTRTPNNKSSAVAPDAPLSESVTQATSLGTPFEHELPLGLPEYFVPSSNPMTHEKVGLGEKLFFDNALSVDHTMSCATCHDPDKGWSNGMRVAEGVNGKSGNRNVPTIVNAAFYRSLFWDGRAGSLEGQALGPILNENEMGIPSAKALVDRLRENDEYTTLFAKAFSDGLTAANVARSIACYERTIVAGNSPYDRYVAGDKSAMSASATRGMTLFFDKQKGKCSICHEAPAFTAMFYHNLGVGMDQAEPDLGRYEVTKLESNKGKFKVPTVRDVVDTAPYMHDGSIATLEEVIDLYDKGGIANRHLSKEMRGKLNLTKEQKQDLLAFMVEGLTSDDKPTP